MLGQRKLILDTHCEVYDLLKPWADDHFWDFSQHQPIDGAVYLIGRRQFIDHKEKILPLVDRCTIILSNPHEGSSTLKGLCAQLGIDHLARQGKIMLIGGGDMEPCYRYLQFESFMPKILDYKENQQAQQQTEEIFKKTHKPYKFLFLNGRARFHRKYLLDRFQHNRLLEQALWSNLDSSAPVETRSIPSQYEFTRYRQRTIDTVNHYKKPQLFDNEWGEIYLEPSAYIDTYFSVVTETVFEYPWSFRTEKIWKPIAMGHPWIAVTNAGYYRDIRNLGFQTFEHVIDESFDLITDNQQRLERVAVTIEDLCRQDLASFLKECYNVCKYNQQHLEEIRGRFRQEFPDQFFQFIKSYQ